MALFLLFILPTLRINYDCIDFLIYALPISYMFPRLFCIEEWNLELSIGTIIR